MIALSHQQANTLSLCYEEDVNDTKINLNSDNPISKDNSKQKGKFMMRRYNDNCVRSLNGILMTGYVLKGYENILNLTIPETSHILCIKYYLKQRSLNRTGDTQLFVTGGGKKNETNIDAMKREVCEETTLEIIDTSNAQFLGSYYSNQNNIHWYSCPIENMKVKCNTIKPNKSNKWNRMKKTKKTKNKIACIIWGSKDEICNKMKQIKINHVRNKEGIDGLISIPFTDVKKIIETIKINQYGFSHKFCWNYDQTYKFLTSRRSISSDEVCDFISALYKGSIL
jgi:hypothetical protein